MTTAALPFIVAATFFMEYLDTTIIATALPQMARSFSVGPNEVSLGMTAYMLTLAVFIPVSGWIADRFGSRTVFGGALVLFTIASVLCGLSTGIGFFTGARGLAGGGGGQRGPGRGDDRGAQYRQNPADEGDFDNHMAGNRGAGHRSVAGRLHHHVRVVALGILSQCSLRAARPRGDRKLRHH